MVFVFGSKTSLGALTSCILLGSYTITKCGTTITRITRRKERYVIQSVASEECLKVKVFFLRVILNIGFFSSGFSSSSEACKKILKAKSSVLTQSSQSSELLKLKGSGEGRRNVSEGF